MVFIMGRKSQYSKELKLDTAKQYLNHEGSYFSLGKEVGTSKSVISDWVSKYKEYGDNAFDVSNTNASYTKEFKEKVVLAYLNGEGSYLERAIKFNIASHSIIIGWVKSYNSHMELKDYLPGGNVYMTKSRKVSKVERLEIVKYSMEHDLDYKASAKVYEVSYANLYNWVKKNKELGEEGLGDNRGVHKSNEELAERILKYNEIFDPILGYRMMADRIHRDEGKQYHDKQVYKIMRILGIKSRIRPTRRSCTVCKKNNTAKNILKRDFNASRPNEKWCGDVIEFKYGKIKEKKLYLSVFLDLYNRSSVGYEISNRNYNPLVFHTFDKAVAASPVRPL